MIPFMSAQSQALAYGFGIDYEYGKRTIKAMSNEQFNSLTASDVTNLVNERNNEILRQLQAQLPAFTQFQSEIIDKQVQVEVAKANRTPSAMAEIITALLAGGHEATADAIQNYVGTSENKDTALQTLSLISPIFALMGLANTSDGGDTTPTGDTRTASLIKWQILTQSVTQGIWYYLDNTAGGREYSWDHSQKQFLLDQKTEQLSVLNDKYPDYNLYTQAQHNFGSFDEQLILDAKKFAEIRDEWDVINGTT